MYERFVSATGRLSFYEMVSAASSLPTKIPFPRTETTAGRDSVRACVRLLRRKVEQLVLAGPLRRQIGALTRSGTRKANEIVMLIFLAQQFSRLAILSALAVGSATSSIKPTTATGKRCHQSRPRLRTDRASMLRADSPRAKESRGAVLPVSSAVAPQECLPRQAG